MLALSFVFSSFYSFFTNLLLYHKGKKTIKRCILKLHFKTRFQYDYLHPIYQVVLMAVQLVSVLVELVRPYLGYYGNLAEKVFKQV